MRRTILIVGVLALLTSIVLAGCSLLQVPPSVDFVASSVEGPAPLVIEFEPLVEGAAVSYAWDFGDGRTSVEANPLHVYTDAGTYSVMLTVGFADHEPIILQKKRFVTAGEPLRQASTSYLYWITVEGNAIKRGAPTGGASQLLASQAYLPSALNVGGGKIFWVTQRWDGPSPSTIDSINRDASRNSYPLEEYRKVWDIAVDVRNKKIYWVYMSERGWDVALKRADFDFSNVEVLKVYPQESQTYPLQVVVDSESEIVYWSEIVHTEGATTILQAMIMASSTRDFLPYDVMELVDVPGTMVLDTLPEFGARNLYYTAGSRQLRCARLDGTSDIRILGGLNHPRGVAVDAYSGRIYVGTYDGIFFTEDGEELEALYPDEGFVHSVVLVR